MKKAIFLDRDGTLIENIPNNADPQKVRLAPFAIEALQQLQEKNYLLIVISNQPGIALGIFTENEMHRMNRQVADLLWRGKIMLEDVYCCMHHKNGIIPKYAKNCECRKPRPGLLLQASKDHDIDLSSSWMIGDILDDVEAGARAGCQTILIDNGNETEWKNGSFRTPHFVVKDLWQAAGIIEQTVKNERLERL